MTLSFMEMAGLLVARLSTILPYFAARLYWSVVILLILDALPDEIAELW